MLCVFSYGLSSGLPLLLLGGTLKAWMKEAHVDLTLIGIFSLVQIPYTLKFLWSPLMDRFVPPFLGRRRGWILITQIALCAGLIAMGMVKPDQQTALLATLAVIVAFFSASQDIVIDAYRRDLLPDNELGLGSSMAVNGYQVGMLIAGAGALALADHIPWSMVYVSMGVLMGLSTLITFFSPEPEIDAPPPKTMNEAIVLPFKDYFRRSHAIEILAFVLLFKIGDQMASDMLNPFYLDIGFTKTQIAAIAKLFGFWATIGGAMLGGMAMVRIGMIRSLWIFGILQTISTFGFSVLATAGGGLGLLTFVVVFENLCTGMARSAYVGFMASLCNKRFSATQFALLSSLIGVPRSIFGSSSGYLAKHFGWHWYFVFCALLHLPGLVLLIRLTRYYREEANVSA